jgi:hypothetical protein
MQPVLSAPEKDTVQAVNNDIEARRPYQGSRA